MDKKSSNMESKTKRNSSQYIIPQQTRKRLEVEMSGMGARVYSQPRFH